MAEMRMSIDLVFANNLVERVISSKEIKQAINTFGFGSHPLLSEVMKDKTIQDDREVLGHLRYLFEQIICRQELEI